MLTEVEKNGRKRKVVIKNVIGIEEEKEMMRRVKGRREVKKEGREMVNGIEVETEERRRAVRTEIESEEGIKREKGGERWKDVKEAEIETLGERRVKRWNGKIGIEEKKGQRTGRETSENEGKKRTEIDWTMKIKILTTTKGGEVINMTRKIMIQIEGRSIQKMR